tara:strand:+ start:34 stop:759 length:726 start_codon:yes stop_codon:yes gene_type:complete
MIKMHKTKPTLSEMKLKPTTMKLSDKTISVLKNFSSINQSILFKEGRKLRTISVMKNILAEATVTEEFMKDFGIYDLNQFLNGLSLHSSPELDFANDGYVMIREGRSRSKYFFADPNVIVTPPEKEITLPSEDVTFELSTDQLAQLLKASAVYQLPDLSAVGENGVVKLVVRDKKNDTSNDYAVVVGETEATFSFNFKVENIKVLPGTYEVVVSQKLLSRFTSKNHDLTYYIALEPDSTFG